MFFDDAVDDDVDVVCIRFANRLSLDSRDLLLPNYPATTTPLPQPTTTTTSIHYIARV